MYRRLSILISRINLAKAQRIESYEILFTKINASFLSKLEQLGIIRGFEVNENKFRVYMKFVNIRAPFIHIKFVGKSSRSNSIKIERLIQASDKNGSSIFILSTGY